jgi:hypothetical protein
MNSNNEDEHLEWAIHPKQRAAHIRSFTQAIMHGDDEHRAWLKEAAEAFLEGRELPPPRAGTPILTNSQRMALVSILVWYATDRNQPQEFYDCSLPDAPVTRVEDLILVLMGIDRVPPATNEGEV